MKVGHLWSRLWKCFYLLSKTFHIRFETLEDLTFWPLDKGGTLILIFPIQDDRCPIGIFVCDPAPASHGINVLRISINFH